MEYKIIHTESHELCEQLVNDAIAEGWQPIGGVGFARREYVRDGYMYVEWHYAQAMTRIGIPTPLVDAYSVRVV